MKEVKMYEVSWAALGHDPQTGEEWAGESQTIHETKNKDVAFRKAIAWSKKKEVNGIPLYETDVRELTDGDTTNHWFFKNGEQQISMFS